MNGNASGARGDTRAAPDRTHVHQPNGGTTSNPNNGQPNTYRVPNTSHPSQPLTTTKNGTGSNNPPAGKATFSKSPTGTNPNPNPANRPSGPNTGYGKSPAGNGYGSGPATTAFGSGGPRADVGAGPAQKAAFHEPARTVRQLGDKQVAFDRRGRPREIRARGIEVRHGIHGDRRFVAQHNGRTIVGLGPRAGYMQGGYRTVGSRVYVERTYVFGGVRYARAYRTYYWHGAVFYRYAPVYYYHPAFYVWAFNPWPQPVVYAWGWLGSPWYPAYGYYFAAAPSYPTASLWLTDYALSEDLRFAYESQQNPGVADQQDVSGTPDSGSVPLSPEVKQAIADEVARQLSAEQASANPNAPAPPPSNPNLDETPSVLDANHKLFVVSSNLDVVSEDGSECSLTPGDVIQRTSATPDGSKVAVSVITSKRGDCAVNTSIGVEVGDLQEMQNRLREQMDAGLKVLADNQGQNGLPAAPDTATTTGEVPAPSPDRNAEAELQDQQKVADKLDADAKPSRGEN
jgi:hypothetical protein